MSDLKIIWRSQWGATPFTRTPTPNPLSAESVLFLHHTISSPIASESLADEIAKVKQVEQVHLDRGWIGVGYSWLISPSGRAFQGRGFSRVPAAQSGANYGNGAIAFLGDFEKVEPTWAARRAAIYLIREFWLPATGGRFIGGHRDVNATGCPGGALYERSLPRIADYTGLSLIEPRP